MPANQDHLNSIEWHMLQVQQMEIHITSLNRLLITRTNRDLSVSEINRLLKEANVRLVHMRSKLTTRGRKYRRAG